MNKKITLIILPGAALSFAHAETKSFRFQGRLTDNKGRPFPGSPQVQFEIFDAFTGGNKLWQSSSSQTVTTNNAGLFSTDIGPVSAELFTPSSELYLQISVRDVGTTQTLQPRQKLSYVPYAIQSAQAENAKNAESVKDKSITSLKIVDNAIQEIHIASDAITSGKIKDKTIQSEDLSPNAIDSSSIKDESIAHIDLATDAVRSSNILDRSIEGKKFSSGTITSEEILDGGIRTVDLQNESISSEKLQDAAVFNRHLTTGAVENKNIADKTIKAGKIDIESLAAAGFIPAPPNAVFMFLNSCPEGYDELSQFRNHIAIGADVGNKMGMIPDEPGKEVPGDFNHTHRFKGNASFGEEEQAFDARSIWTYFSNPVALTAVVGSQVSGVGARGKQFVIGGETVSSNHLLPAITVMFCQRKQNP